MFILKRLFWLKCQPDALSLWPRRSRAKFDKTSLSTNVSLRSGLSISTEYDVGFISMAELLLNIFSFYKKVLTFLLALYYNYHTIISTWACTGFDGDFEVEEAICGLGPHKNLEKK